MFEHEDSYRRKVSQLRDEIMFHEEEIDINYLHTWLGNSKDVFNCSRKDEEAINNLKQLIDNIEDWFNNQIGNDYGNPSI